MFPDLAQLLTEMHAALNRRAAAVNQMLIEVENAIAPLEERRKNLAHLKGYLDDAAVTVQRASQAFDATKEPPIPF